MTNENPSAAGDVDATPFAGDATKPNRKDMNRESTLSWDAFQEHVKSNSKRNTIKEVDK